MRNRYARILSNHNMKIPLSTRPIASAAPKREGVKAIPVSKILAPSKPSSSLITAEEVQTTPILDLDEYLRDGVGPIDIPRGVRWVKSKGKIRLGRVTALVGDCQILQFTSWEATPDQLFDLDESEEFAVVGITFVCAPNRPLKTALPYKSLFGWTRNKVKRGKFAWINGPEVSDKELVTFGLSGYCYSSDSKDRIYLIAKNVHHNGYLFTQCKNPYQGNLWLVILYSSVHNPILVDVGGPLSSPSSMFYTPTSFKVRIEVSKGVATLISDHTFDQIKTWVGYNEGNQRSILHFDRFVFDINEQNLIDNKRIQLGGTGHNRPTQVIGERMICSDLDLSPGDNLQGFGRIISKQIDEAMVERTRKDGSKWWDRRSNWTYKFEPNALQSFFYLPSGQFDGYLVHKGNALFQQPITKNTKFGPGYWESGHIIQSQGFGWSWYNEESSGYIEGFDGGGYYRNSTGSGSTEGTTIRGSRFEKNPPKATADRDLPEEVQTHIQYLESLR